MGERVKRAHKKEVWGHNSMTVTENVSRILNVKIFLNLPLAVLHCAFTTY